MRGIGHLGQHSITLRSQVPLLDRRTEGGDISGSVKHGAIEVFQQNNKVGLSRPHTGGDSGDSSALVPPENFIAFGVLLGF